MSSAVTMRLSRDFVRAQSVAPQRRLGQSICQPRGDSGVGRVDLTRHPEISGA